MRRLTSMAIAVSLAGFALSTGSVAAEVKAEKTPQQQRMTDCNKEAAEKKLAGDARKQFMSSCLGGKTDAKPAASTQQEKMKSCNDEAGKKSLKGDERKKFMSNCLSG